MRGFGADASVSGGAPCLGIETRNTKPSVGTSRRRLSDLKFAPLWFGARRECSSGGTGSCVRLQFRRRFKTSHQEIADNDYTKSADTVYKHCV